MEKSCCTLFNMACLILFTTLSIFMKRSVIVNFQIVQTFNDRFSDGFHSIKDYDSFLYFVNNTLATKFLEKEFPENLEELWTDPAFEETRIFKTVIPLGHMQFK
mmetsp:Transcript_40364/g.38839  ORF Transcript_40364/g.38839 Transcript_40364/m.38839 type:complete len:104 (-) Transcript_40364:639-950(-)